MSRHVVTRADCCRESGVRPAPDRHRGADQASGGVQSKVSDQGWFLPTVLITAGPSCSVSLSPKLTPSYSAPPWPTLTPSCWSEPSTRRTLTSWGPRSRRVSRRTWSRHSRQQMASSCPKLSLGLAPDPGNTGQICEEMITAPPEEGQASPHRMSCLPPPWPMLTPACWRLPSPR